MRQTRVLLLRLLLLAALSAGCAGGKKTRAGDPVGGPADAAASDSGLTLLAAVERSAEKIAQELPKGSRVAIVAFEAENGGLSDCIMEELAGALFDRGIEVADRQNLGYLYQEFSFQMSGAVEDAGVKEVGKFLAADMVISGQLADMGGAYRFRVNAVRVEQATRASVIRLSVRGDEAMRQTAAAFADQTKAAKTAGYGAGEDKTPKTSGEFLDRGLLSASRGDFDAAVGELDEALRLNPDMAAAHVLRGRALFASASDVVSVDANFGNVMVSANKELTEEQTELYGRAIADFAAAIRLDPENAAIFRERGRAYYLSGDFDKAMADFDQAIKLNPDYAAVYQTRGALYSNKGQYKKAIADYDQAIRRDSAHVAAFYSRGNAHRSLGDLDDAIADYSRAVELDPTLVAAFYNRGNSHRSLGDLDSAIADYGRVIELKPDLAEAYINRGNMYDEKGEYANAIADFEAALKVDPNNAGAKQHIERIRQQRGQ
jgi:tetratricopeptide (TPR) repeat protein